MLDLTPITVTITATGSLSTVANLGIKTLVGIQLPSNWTTAALSFQVSSDGGTTFQELFDGVAGTAVSVAATAGVASQFIAMSNDGIWSGVNCLKVRSGSSGTPVAQTNTVAVTLLMRTVAF
jgi:hypothetical protein